MLRMNRLTLIAISFILSQFSLSPVRAHDIHITPDSSLVDAVRKAREMRRLGQANEVTIHLAAGTYTLYEPLRLRPEDSGLAIEGDDATISGGMAITGWVSFSCTACSAAKKA